ncbi:MAG: RNA polymerase factor sigma-32 [Holosporales bacterium]|nr:RNA polymerase factor sigma-32 [Holosporales bacterium]
MQSIRIQDTSTLSPCLSHLNDFPILDKDEEYRLACEWQKTGHSEAIDRLVKSHLRLVWKMARGYRGYGLSLEDLVAEGTIGVMQAAQRFDPQRGFRFSTYAQWWIKASMQDYIMRSWSLVKVSTQKTHRKIFFNLNRIKATLGFKGRQTLSEEETRQVAEKMEVPITHLREMEQRLSATDFSLNATRSEDGDEWQDYVEDAAKTPETTILEEQEGRYRHDLLRQAIKHLTPKEYKVLHMRRLSDPPLTFDAIAKKMHLSRERVRQIEQRAFQKLQRTMKTLHQKKPHATMVFLIRFPF